MTDETTPDAVEMLDRVANRCPPNLVSPILDAVSAWRAERARHAEEVARLERERDGVLRDASGCAELLIKTDAELYSLRDQLRKVEGERDDLKRHYEEALECETESFREQLRPLEALRSLLPDVRLIAESAMYETTGGESCPEVLTREARAARNILTALDSQGGGGSDATRGQGEALRGRYPWRGPSLGRGVGHGATKAVPPRQVHVADGSPREEGGGVPEPRGGGE